MNDLILCLQVVSRHVKSSTIALHSTLNISETETEAWFQRTTNKKWYIKWSRDRWRHVTPKVLWGSAVGYPRDSLASCSHLSLSKVFWFTQY